MKTQVRQKSLHRLDLLGDVYPFLQPLWRSRHLSNLLLGNRNMAERVGFEPTVELVVPHAISSRAPSANSGISPLSSITL